MNVTPMPDDEFAALSAAVEAGKSLYAWGAGHRATSASPELLARFTPSLPASGHGEVAGLVEELHELGREDLTRRAKRLLQAKGWKPGDTISLHGAIGLMVDLAADAAKTPPDRCAYPECGCDFDAVCNEAPTPSPVEARADGVRIKALEWERPDLSGGAYEFGDLYWIDPPQLPYRDQFTLKVGRFSLEHKFATLEAAKAAAQADYAARVLAALESTPAQPDPEACALLPPPETYGGSKDDPWVQTVAEAKVLAQEGKADGTCVWCGAAPCNAPGYCATCLGGGAELTSQPDPAAEIAELQKDRQELHATVRKFQLRQCRTVLAQHRQASHPRRARRKRSRRHQGGEATPSH